MADAARFVSVVTAVHAPSVAFLPAAYESLATQEMPAGWDWQWLVQEDGTDGHPVHPATLCIRRDLLLGLGGWMALPASEDTGLLLPADAVATGYFTAETGLFYRKWPGQLTAHAAHIHPIEQDHRNSVIEARARLLAATFGDTWTFTTNRSHDRHEPIA